MAAKLGFDGVQVSLGRTPVADKLPLDDAAIQSKYLEAAKQHGIALSGTCLDILHVDHLKDNPRAQKWVADSIPITANLKAEVVLLPFFGKASLMNHTEMDYVGGLLKEIAPAAEKAGVMLGLEDTISAEDNVRIMERAGSPAVKVYYDVGNSTGGGFDVVKEIRWLGAQRICQMHLKDNPHYLGEGQIDFPGGDEGNYGYRVRGICQSGNGFPVQIRRERHDPELEVHPRPARLAAHSHKHPRT